MQLLNAFMAWRWRTVVVAAAIVVFVLFLVNAVADYYVLSKSTAPSDAEQSASSRGGTPARRVSTFTPKVDAYDLYVRGRTMVSSSQDGDLARASELFKRAIEIDPLFAGGYAGEAQAGLLKFLGCSDSCEHHLNTALKMARKAIELDLSFGAGYHFLAEALYLDGAFEDALAAARKAVELVPDDALVRASYGRILAYSGQAEEGIQQVEEARNTGSDLQVLLYELGSVYRFNGQFDDAIKVLREHRRRLRGRMLPSPTAQLAAAYMQGGRLMEARATIQALRRELPRFSIQQALRAHRFASAQATATYRKALRDSGLRDE